MRSTPDALLITICSTALPATEISSPLGFSTTGQRDVLDPEDVGQRRRVAELEGDAIERAHVLGLHRDEQCRTQRRLARLRDSGRTHRDDGRRHHREQERQGSRAVPEHALSMSLRGLGDYRGWRLRGPGRALGARDPPGRRLDPMTAPTKGDRVMFDGRAGQPPESRDDAPHEPGRAMAVKPYHLVPADSTQTLCGDDVTGWRRGRRAVGRRLRLQAVPRRARRRQRSNADS